MVWMRLLGMYEDRERKVIKDDIQDVFFPIRAVFLYLKEWDWSPFGLWHEWGVLWAQLTLRACLRIGGARGGGEADSPITEPPERQIGKDEVRELRKSLPQPAFALIYPVFSPLTKGMLCIHNNLEHHSLKSICLFYPCNNPMRSAMMQVWNANSPGSCRCIGYLLRKGWLFTQKEHLAKWHSAQCSDCGKIQSRLCWSKKVPRLEPALIKLPEADIAQAGYSWIDSHWKMQLLGQPEGFSQQIRIFSPSVLIVPEAKL